MSAPVVPPSGILSPALTELCGELGVEASWTSGGGRHAAPLDTVVAALRTLGAPLERAGEATQALEAVREARRARLLPPTTVSWTDETPAVTVTLPPGQAPPRLPDRPLELDLRLEDGSRGSRAVDPDEVAWSREAAAPEGGAPVAGRLPLPPDVPPGYHEVRVRLGRHRSRTVLVRAPRRAWRPGADPGGAAEAPPPSGPPTARRWATFLPLHALRSHRNHGVGDLADLRELAAWTGRRGGALVGTLPLYDTFLGEGEPFDPSPYSPVSRLFWNPLWIALDEAPGLERSPEARALLGDGEVREAARELRETDRVDYGRVMALKRRVLEALAGTHGGDGPHGLGPDLARRVREDPEALAYARFRAAVEATGRPWVEWDGAARGGDATALDAPDQAVRYHVYAQWAVERQLEGLADAGAAPGLYLDLPLGAHPHGFDHWRHQWLFADGFTVGAPPDAFFEGGQDWGFPPVHPHRSREDGHGYFAACLRRAMGVSRALRLDHVMALHRLYWVPRGAGATEGVYVRYPRDEMWAVLCLESRRNRTEVVGEDLGTVPPEVPRAMEDHGVRRMWVLPFEVAAGEEDEPYRAHLPSPDSVACLDTHDLPPFAAFLRGTDIEARVDAGHTDEARARAERSGRAAWRDALLALLRDRGLLAGKTEAAGSGARDGDAGTVGVPDSERPTVAPDTTSVLRATLHLLASSDADLVLVNLEDLWLETSPQNLPGIPGGHNWTRKARLSLEAMSSDPRVLELLAAVDRHR